MKMRAVALLTALTMAPMACLAQEIPAPQGCVDLVTIQSADCSVRRVSACDDPDAAFLVEVFGPDGLTLTQHLGPEGGVTRVVQAPEEDFQMSAEADPVSAATLQATGSDRFDFTLSLKGGGGLQYVGTTKLTGATVSISGHTIPVSQTRLQAFSAQGLEQNQDIVGYFVADLGFVISGLGTDATTGDVIFDRTPVALLYPGEPGALSEMPLYGCGGE